MPLLCSRSSKVKERRAAPPTLTDVRKAELQRRREKELNRGPMPVLDTHAACSPCPSASLSVQSSDGGASQTSPGSPGVGTQSTSTATHPVAHTGTAPSGDTLGITPRLTLQQHTLMASSSSYLCCSMRVADQPEDAGYYIYAVDVQDAGQPQQRVKLCSTSPPRRTKPLAAQRPAPIFVPFEEY